MSVLHWLMSGYGSRTQTVGEHGLGEERNHDRNDVAREWRRAWT